MFIKTGSLDQTDNRSHTIAVSHEESEFRHCDIGDRTAGGIHIYNIYLTGTIYGRAWGGRAKRMREVGDSGKEKLSIRFFFC